LGETEAQRNKNPFALLDKIKVSETGISGFRYFHNHDARILDVILNDPKCAKIILTRNPLDSFVSWKIAVATGQWKLTNTTHLKTAQVEFNLEQFEDYLTELQNFQIEVQRCLQVSGQSAFYVRYEDLADLDVVNGIARFLGSQSQLERLSKKLKRQNPRPIAEKVANFEDLKRLCHQLIGLTWHERRTLNPNVAPPFRAMSPRQNPRCYSCRFHPGQTGKSRAGWRHWIKRIRRSCSAILVKDRCVAGKTAILITAVSLLCTTLSHGPMKYFAGIFYQSKTIAMQNCAKGCAGCTTSLFPSIQMIRPYQPGKFANASANS
ncbi:MAG: hypothetical protein HON63_09315, partial [Rhodobacteraceae bacterium]|nr:hypothetical protein [Paracoccaceae bacterium]